MTIKRVFPSFVSRELYEGILKENERLKKELAELKKLHPDRYVKEDKKERNTDDVDFFLDSQIYKSNLHGQITNALERKGCNTWRDVTEMPYRDLIACRGIGKKNLTAILDYVHKNGYTMIWETDVTKI